MLIITVIFCFVLGELKGQMKNMLLKKMQPPHSSEMNFIRTQDDF